MTEQEYILLTNLTKMRAAQKILGDVLPDQPGSPTQNELANICALLSQAIEKAEDKIRVR